MDYSNVQTEQFAAVSPSTPWPSAVAGRAPKAKKVRRWPWALGALVVGIAIGSAGGHTATPATAALAAPVVSAPAPAAPAPVVEVPPAAPALVQPAVVEAPAPAAPAGPLTRFGNGTYEVGIDVKPGKYRSAGVADSVAPLCYFDQTDAGGAIKDQGVANEGPSRATLRAGLTFKSSGCQEWVFVG
jgi:hypothetical protein